MESFIGEISENKEIPPYQKVDRIYIKKDKRKRDDRHRRWSEGLEQDMVFEQYLEWDDKAKEDMLEKNPRIIIPIDLSSSATDIRDIVPKLPYIPYARSNEDPNVLIAAGFQEGEIRNGFNGHTRNDDALRKFIVDLEKSDDESPIEKLRTYLEEKGFEDAFMVASNLVTIFRIFPPLTIPLMAARGAINARDLAHSQGIDIFRRFSNRLDDPDTYARLKRLTKHFFEKTDDYEFEDAVVLLKVPESLDYLRSIGIEGNTLALVDDEHAEGENLWSSADKQFREVSSAFEDLISIRQEFATIYGEHLQINDWAEFRNDLLKYFGGVTVHAVRERPPKSTIGTVSAQIREIHKLKSKKMEEVVDRAFLSLGIRTEEDPYPGSDWNDF